MTDINTLQVKPQVAKFCTKCGEAFGDSNYCRICGYCRYNNFLPQQQTVVISQGSSGIGWFVMVPIGFIFAVIAALMPYLWILVPFIILAIVLVASAKKRV